ncbi:DinB family protein [Chitinophaga lutea]
MKSVFDAAVRAELLQRIDALDESSTPLWGKMTVGQMVRHCTLCDDYYLGRIPVPRSFLGRLIGQSAIRSILKDQAVQMQKNAPTAQAFLVKDEVRDLAEEKRKWRAVIGQYERLSVPSFNHWFFGKMNRDQLGQFAYKHADHHLRQFGK